MSDLVEELFATLSDVRYVAVYRDGDLQLSERPDLLDPSRSESDRYEELFVNPTLLKLAHQRGIVDCGGFEYVIVRYGSFFQLVHPISKGHISVAIEATGDPFAILRQVRFRLAEAGLVEPV